MQLQIKPYHTNIYPLNGFLIKGAHVSFWLKQLQNLQIDIQQINCYIIPDAMPNSIWGCFVESTIVKNDLVTLYNIEQCQCLNNCLFIPEYANITPLLSIQEIEKLFSSCKYIMHPSFGLVALESKIDWSTFIKIDEPVFIKIEKPVDSIFIPKHIKKIEVKALPPEELLKSMEENVFPTKEKFDDKPLSLGEKIKLGLLKVLLKPASLKGSKDGGTEKISAPNFFDKILNKLGGNKLMDKLESNLEELEKRNSSEMEKLMKLFKENPEEALKYAIPIDNEGTTRGGNNASFSMSKRWGNFNLFGNQSFGSSSGSSVFADDSFMKLQQQYNQSAAEFIKQKNYERAAFIYLKLLKNNYMAAKTLEDGTLYPEAAAVYLKYVNDKNKAAECYEKGEMTTTAIDLYTELNKNEKVGDLYMKINNKQEAFLHYNKVVDTNKKEGKYVNAALLLRNKMDNKTDAQDLLFDGYKENKDAFNCINNYFQNIDDTKLLGQAIDNVYAHDATSDKKAVFLKALKHEHKKDDTIAIRTKEIAYEIVADLAAKQPDIVSELKNFNDDKSLVKDVTRFKQDK
jgi:tetratricopeptide (TPR) repeat protein